MLRLLLVVLALAISGCEPAFYKRPDFTIWEIPQDATILPLPVTSLAWGGAFGLSSVSRAQLEPRGDGVIRARVTGQEVYYTGSDFGGAIPVFVPIVLCYELTAGKQTLTGYQAGNQGDLSACPTVDVPAVTARELPPAFARLNGTLIDGAQVSGFSGQWNLLSLSDSAFFGSATTLQKPQSEFPDFVREQDVYERSLVMRASMRASVADTVALDFAPDAVDMLSEVTANPGPTGIDLFWRQRDESIFRVANDSVPLKLQYLGQGVFNLKNAPNVQAATGETVGNLVVGDQWTALFATRGKRLNLSFRTRKVATTEFKSVRPFQPTIAASPNPRAVRVCFNEQLEVASVGPEAFTFDPPVAVVSAFASASQLCVFITTALREPRAYTVTAKSLRSVFGNALPSRGVQFSVNGDRDRVLNLAVDLFRGDTDSQGRPVVVVKTVVPTSSGGVVSISADFGDQVLSRADNQLSFVSPVETLNPDGLSWVPDVKGRGLWVLSAPDAGATTVVRYDDLPAERLELAGANLSLVSLGDGAAIVNSDRTAITRIAQGVASPLPAAFAGVRVWGFVNDSSDVLTSGANVNSVVRRSVIDGSVLATWGPVINRPTQFMNPYLCAGFLYQVLDGGGTAEITAGGPTEHIDCAELSKAPDGTVYVTTSGANPQRLFALTDGGISRVDWRVTTGADAPVVVKPRFVANGVFFEAQTQTRRSPSFANRAQWSQLTDGGAR